MNAIPRTHFTTDRISPKDRFDVFRDSMSVLFDVELEKNRDSQLFKADVEAYMLDQLMLARTSSIQASYNRNPQSIRRDGIDMIMIQLYLRGEEDFRYDSHVTHVKTGDIVVYDLSKEAMNSINDFTNLSVIFPRDLIESYIPTVSRWHCQILPRERPMTKLLKAHILSLYEIAPSITTESCSSIQRTLLELASSALQHSSDILPAYVQSVSSSLLLEIKKWINSHLAEPGISVDSISRAFSLSRAQLYRVTEPLGGIMNHIREQRLKKTYSDLRDPALVHLTVTDVLYRWGFNDPNTFTRSFKKRFDMLPKDVKKLPHSHLSENSLQNSKTKGDGYDDWLRSLSL
jgi:AraC-like DNA-binding protein